MRLLAFVLFFYSTTASAMDFAAFFRELTLAFTVSNLEYKSINDDLKAEASLALSNRNQEKFLYRISSSIFYEQNLDPDENRMDSEQKSDFQLRFALKNVLNGIHYTNFTELKNQKRDGQYTIKYDLDVGPVGLKKEFYTSNLVSELSLEYMPLYNFREFYYPGPDDSVVRTAERLIKHRLNFIMSFQFFEKKLSVSETASVQKITALDHRPIHTYGNDFDNRVDLTLHAYSSLDLGYSFGVNVDQIRDIQGLDRTERTHKFNVTFRLN